MSFPVHEKFEVRFSARLTEEAPEVELVLL
jgi:hypothetical protein